MGISDLLSCFGGRRIAITDCSHCVSRIKYRRKLIKPGYFKTDSHVACRAHAVPLPCRATNSHMPCRPPALLRQCRVLRESPRGSRKYSNC